MREADRIKALMKRYDLSRNEMAIILQTPPSTLDDWLKLKLPRTPPSCMRLVLDLLEQSTQARRIAGLHCTTKGAPRGKPFKKGNPYRIKPAPKLDSNPQEPK
jgi:hypothetical protein